MPKSMICTRTAPAPTSETSMFSSERSRCARPSSCSQRTAVNTCRNIGLIQISRSWPRPGDLKHQEKRSPRVAREVTMYMFVSLEKTPSSSAVYGKRSSFRALTRPISCHGCSEAVGCLARNACGLVPTHVAGILFTATRRPSDLVMRSTRPWFISACSSVRTRPKEPSSFGQGLMSSTTRSIAAVTSGSESDIEAAPKDWSLAADPPLLVEMESLLATLAMLGLPPPLAALLVLQPSPGLRASKQPLDCRLNSPTVAPLARQGGTTVASPSANAKAVFFSSDTSSSS
mmetsp:Transcript_19880/g.59576  ORF Transcript_19880/g.59576 Transcript_19880/m.59576 type:complete len:288 (+) Transcript_19880:993-1856(+)